MGPHPYVGSSVGLRDPQCDVSQSVFGASNVSLDSQSVGPSDKLGLSV